MNAHDLRLIRMANQGLFDQKQSVQQVLHQTVGMQAQQQRHTAIGLFLRDVTTTPESLELALSSSQVVRSWAHRWTYQLLNYTDWQMIIAVRSAERLPNAYFLGQKELISKLAAELTTLLKARKTITKFETEVWFNQATPVVLTGQMKYGVLQLLTSRGNGYFDASVTAPQYTLVASDPSALPDPQIALSTLITRYLAGFAPASMADFCKWAGIATTTVAPVWHRLAKNWVSIDVAGQQLFSPVAITAAQLQNYAITAARHPILTGGFDALMTGYVDKEWLVSAKHVDQLWTANGWLQPLIIINGNVVGTWKFKLTGRKIQFTVVTWVDVSAGDEAVIRTRLEAVAQFLNKVVTAINFTPLQ